jgi:hypothetical protein
MDKENFELLFFVQMMFCGKSFLGAFETRIINRNNIVSFNFLGALKKIAFMLTFIWIHFIVFCFKLHINLI